MIYDIFLVNITWARFMFKYLFFFSFVYKSFLCPVCKVLNAQHRTSYVLFKNPNTIKLSSSFFKAISHSPNSIWEILLSRYKIKVKISRNIFPQSLKTNNFATTFSKFSGRRPGPSSGYQSFHTPQDPLLFKFWKDLPIPKSWLSYWSFVPKK